MAERFERGLCVIDNAGSDPGLQLLFISNVHCAGSPLTLSEYVPRKHHWSMGNGCSERSASFLIIIIDGNFKSITEGVVQNGADHVYHEPNSERGLL